VGPEVLEIPSPRESFPRGGLKFIEADSKSFFDGDRQEYPRQEEAE
jgi:hypothetical protein